MKDKRQRLQSMVWPYNMAAAAAAVAAAADQSAGLYAYLMQSSLFYPYNTRIMPAARYPSSLSPSSPDSSTVALVSALQSSPLAYLAAGPRPTYPPPSDGCRDRLTPWNDAATRQRAAMLVQDTERGASCPSVSHSGVSTSALFRPYQSLMSVGVASD